MQTNEAWDGYPKGAIMKSIHTGIIVEILGPAHRKSARVLRDGGGGEPVEYDFYCQDARIIEATDEEGADVVKAIHEYNDASGLDRDTAVAALGQFVFYTGEEE